MVSLKTVSIHFSFEFQGGTFFALRHNEGIKCFEKFSQIEIFIVELHTILKYCQIAHFIFNLSIFSLNVFFTFVFLTGYTLNVNNR